MNTDTALNPVKNSWALVRALEIEIENTEMRIARLRSICSEARHNLSTTAPGSEEYQQWRTKINLCTARVADLKEYIADCHKRKVRLQKQQTSDLTAISMLAAALLMIALIVF